MLQVYLAREEGSREASVSWKFDCSQTDVKVNDVTVTAVSSTFQSGNIVWSLTDGERSVRLSGGRVQYLCRFILENIFFPQIFLGWKFGICMEINMVSFYKQLIEFSSYNR